MKISLIIKYFIIIFLTLLNFEETNEINKNERTKDNSEIINKKCYTSFKNKNTRIIHLILTRFLIGFNNNTQEFDKLLNTDYYLLNGIRVMKKFLIPSLEHQSCKNFTWVLLLGNQINITKIITKLNIKLSFNIDIIHKNEIKNYIANKTKGFDVLITTRIDYDDIIYFDATNDVRKLINMNKPMILHGYNRGVYYFEPERKFFEYYSNNKNGCLAIFLSLIIVLKKVTGIYTIFDIGPHPEIRTYLINKRNSFGIKKFNYEPAIFDNESPKFVYVRQKYSHNYNLHKSLKFKKEIKFNINKLYNIN